MQADQGKAALQRRQVQLVAEQAAAAALRKQLQAEREDKERSEQLLQAKLGNALQCAADAVRHLVSVLVPRVRSVQMSFYPLTKEHFYKDCIVHAYTAI